MSHRIRIQVVKAVLAVAFLGFSAYTLHCSLSEYHAEQTQDPTVARAKIRIHHGRQYLWAAGPLDSRSERSEWFDLTGSPLPLDEVQYGIGRDTIRSIDHPVFVDPDDARLREKWAVQRGENIDDLPVIGFAHDGVARAYPVPLLDHHELVNDTVAGKPVTVGW